MQNKKTSKPQQMPVPPGINPLEFMLHVLDIEKSKSLPPLK